MKRFSIIVLTTLMSIILTSCSKYWPEYEDAYFKYASEKTSDTGVFIGFTEHGLQQTHLILPAYINGIRMRGIGYRPGPLIGSALHSAFEHDNLEKMYVDVVHNDDTSFSIHGNQSHLPKAFLVFWRTQTLPFISGERLGDIIGYNLYNPNGIIPSILTKLANISYMFNYENAPTDGYYWIDSHDNTVVDFLPPEPIREGYTFDGWYKEEELINIWNFEKDKTGPELVITDRDQFDESDIKFLYAKWI